MAQEGALDQSACQELSEEEKDDEGKGVDQSVNKYIQWVVV